MVGLPDRTRTGARRFRRAAAVTALMALVGFSVPSVAASVDEGEHKPADLSITLTGPASVLPGAGVTTTFTATASNAAGSLTAKKVVIEVAPLTSPLSLVSWTGCTSNPTPTSCAIGSLTGGAHKSVTYVVSTPTGVAGPSFTTSATVTSPQDPISPAAAAVVLVDTPPPAGSYTIQKSTVTIAPQVGGYRPGDAIGYGIVVTNNGDTTLRNLTIADPGANIDPGPPATGMLTCTAALPIVDFAPGDQVACFAAHLVTQAEVDASATFTNTATATVDQLAPITSSATDQLDRTVSLLTYKELTSGPPAGDYHAGNILDFTITAVNDGSLTVPNVAMSDATATLDACPAATLAYQATMVCTAHHTVTQDEIDAGTYTNTAVVTSDVTKPQDATVEVVLPRNPVVTLSKVITSATPADGYGLGDIITYSLTATSAGNSTLHAVTVTDAGATLGCPATDLAPTAVLNCTATHQVTQADIDAAATYTNTADVTTTELVTDSASVDAPLHRTATMSITKTLDGKAPTAVDTNTTLAFTVVATNTGTRTLTNVDVMDNQAALACTPATPVASLAPGASITCTATSMITQADIDAGTFTNTASATSALTEPVSADATVKLPAAPSLSATKVVTGETTSYVLGTVATFDVTITNSGNVTLTDVALVDASATIGTCTLPLPATLAPADSTTCHVTHTVTQADVDAGSYTNTATASGSRATSAEAKASIDVAQTRSLTLTKQVAVDPAPPAGGYKVGDTVTFDLVATNTGTVTAPAVTITETAADSALGTCPATSLAPLASLTCHATHVVTQADLDNGSYTNTAHAVVPSFELGVDAKASVELSGSRSLRLDKTVTSAGPYLLGSTVTYDIVASNNGTLTLDGVIVSDATAGVTFGTCTPTIGASGVSLAPGASVHCSATHVVTEADFTSGSFTNTAGATARGVEPVSASATVATPHPAVDLKVTNTLTTVLTVGQQASYTLTFSNAGPGSEPNPVATFQVPTGETIVSATGSGWSCAASGATVTCTSASLLVASGSLPNITIVVNVIATTQTTLTSTATISGVRTELAPADNTAAASGEVSPAVLGVTTGNGQLPTTGANLLMPLLLAAGLLGLGVALFLVTRRRSMS